MCLQSIARFLIAGQRAGMAPPAHRCRNQQPTDKLRLTGCIGLRIDVPKVSSYRRPGDTQFELNGFKRSSTAQLQAYPVFRPAQSRGVFRAQDRFQTSIGSARRQGRATAMSARNTANSIVTSHSLLLAPPLRTLRAGPTPPQRIVKRYITSDACPATCTTIQKIAADREISQPLRECSPRDCCHFSDNYGSCPELFTFRGKAGAGFSRVVRFTGKAPEPP